VSILLAEHWDLLPELNAIVKSDAWFLEFVLKHIDESVPADRWAKVREVATTRCPKDSSDLCKAIASRAS